MEMDGNRVEYGQQNHLMGLKILNIYILCDLTFVIRKSNAYELPK